MDERKVEWSDLSGCEAGTGKMAGALGLGGRGKQGKRKERKGRLTSSLSESLRSSLLSILPNLHESSHVVLGLIGLACKNQSRRRGGRRGVSEVREGKLSLSSSLDSKRDARRGKEEGRKTYQQREGLCIAQQQPSSPRLP